jgi:hypothetical protein
MPTFEEVIKAELHPRVPALKQEGYKIALCMTFADAVTGYVSYTDMKDELGKLRQNTGNPDSVVVRHKVMGHESNRGQGYGVVVLHTDSDLMQTKLQSIIGTKTSPPAKIVQYTMDEL